MMTRQEGLILSEKGNKHIIVISDYLTRWPEAFAVPSADAKTVAKLLYDEIICRHSCPRVLQSDRGANFLSRVVRETCRFMGISKSTSSGYHPMTQGLVERFNRTLCQSLSFYTSEHQKDWDEFIPSVLFAYRVTPNTQGSLHSPFMLLYGRNPRLPIDTNLITPKQFTRSIDEHLAKTIVKLEAFHEIARHNISTAQQKYKEIYDRKSKEVTFQVGDWVWVWNPAVGLGKSTKLAFSYTGPFQIVGQISDVTFKVRTGENQTLPKAIHANRLKPYFGQESRPQLPNTNNETDELTDDDGSLCNEASEPAVGETSDNRAITNNTIEPLNNDNAIANSQDGHKLDKTFYVEKILGSRKREGKMFYHIKWLGFSKKDSTWEPSDNIPSDLIKAFDSQKKSRKHGSKK